MVKRLILTSFLTVILGACASTGSGERRQQSVITAAELAEVNATSLYQVVERLRPRWLMVRRIQGGESTEGVVVFQGRAYLGGVETLRQLRVTDASELRYVDGTQASTTLPGLSGRQVEGAIIITP